MSADTHRKLLVQCAAALVALPLLYVLASGPLIRGTFHHPGAAAVTHAIYTPLFRMLDATPFEEAWMRYLNWWDIEVLEMGDDMANPFYVQKSK